MPNRNYRGEYDNYHKKKEQKKRRASRNTARLVMKTAGKVKKGDGKDVAHKNGNPKDNKKKNLTVKPKSINRSFPRTSKAKKVSRRS
jgi:spore germination protein GerM